MDLVHFDLEAAFDDRAAVIDRHNELTDRLNELGIRVGLLERASNTAEAGALASAKLDTINVEPGDVIVMKFPFENFDICVAEETLKLLQSVFANNEVVCIPRGCELTVYSRENSNIEPASVEELHSFIGV